MKNTVGPSCKNFLLTFVEFVLAPQHETSCDPIFYVAVLFQRRRLLHV